MKKIARSLLLTLPGLLLLAAPLVPTRTPPRPSLPWQEVHPCLSFDGSILCCEVSREGRARPHPQMFCHRDEGRGPAGLQDLLLVDLRAHTSQVLPQGIRGEPANGSSQTPYLNRDGTLLAFASEASNLVTGDQNSSQDIFLFDRMHQSLQRVSPPLEQPGECSSFWPSMSANGWLVAYSTFGTSEGQRCHVLMDQISGHPQILTALGETALGPITFGPKGSTLALTRATYGASGPPRIAIFLAQVGRQDGKLEPVIGSWRPLGPDSDGPCWEPCLSEVSCAFASAAGNLVVDDRNHRYDVFLYDLGSTKIRRISLGPQGQEGDDDSFEPSLSADGRWLAFTSYARNFASGVTPGTSNIYLCDCSTGDLKLVSHSPKGQGGNGSSYNPCLSGDGSTLAFASLATNLVGEGQTPGQVYLWNREEDRLALIAPTGFSPAGGLAPGTGPEPRDGSSPGAR